MNTSYLKPLLLRSLQAACGLLAFAFGVYLTIQANIGLAPWDALGMAIAGLTGLSYGVVVVSISLLIVLMDLLLGERIGIGTLLDALLVGSSTDLFLQLGLIPEQNDPIVGVLLMVAGLFIMGFGQFVYMKAELCCGPRDTLLVAIGKRLHKLLIHFKNECRAGDVITSAAYAENEQILHHRLIRQSDGKEAAHAITFWH